MKSIYTESMRAVFRYEEYRAHRDFPSVRFPSPATFVVTKAAAAVVKKRKRDAFDIFVTVQDQDPIAFKERWQHLSRSDGLFSDATEALQEAVHEGDAVEKIQSVLVDMHAGSLLLVAMPSEEQIRDAFAFLNA